MRRILLEPPVASGNAVSFRWSVEPATPLYARPRFEMRFPETVDISAIPESLWWRIAMICLHSHWALLKPCRIEIPIRLDPGEAEFWSRLVDSESASLEAHRGSPDFGRAIEIDERGSSPGALPKVPAGPRSAAAFSGGKDSLLQAGLLCELLREPTLVATTSEMPPMKDHVASRRRRVFSEIVKRRNVSLVEVESDFRSGWDNNFARLHGYPAWITEISDVFLYFAALLAVGVAIGAPHLFVASEAEVQATRQEHDGRILQHTHFMYSVATQRSLAALLRPSGIAYSSTTAALRTAQVERLLRVRYRDLSDLQYSCLEVDEQGEPCSRCSKCFRAALSAVSEGDSPEAQGIDLARLLPAMRFWTPRNGAGGDALPVAAVCAELDEQIARYIGDIPLRRMALAAPRRRWSALLAYARIRRRIAGRKSGPEPGYVAGFLEAADPVVASGLRSIFSEHFAADDGPAAAEAFRRSDALARWIREPLGGTG